jgi:hypothetical protein
MDNRMILKLEELTLQVVEGISSLTYEQLEDFVEEREQMIEHIKAWKIPLQAIDEEYKNKIRIILQYDPLIRSRMNLLKEEAKQHMNKMDQGHILKKAYDIDYTPESVFFDKKK